MTGWALYVPPGGNIAAHAAKVAVPVTTVVSDIRAGLTLVVERHVAGLIVPDYMVLYPLVAEWPGPGGDGPDPTRRRAQIRAPYRLDRPRPHWRE